MSLDGPRANPFLRPSETTLRFVLLGLVTAGVSLNVWHYVSLVISTRRIADGMVRCGSASTREPSPPYSTEHARCWAENVAGPLAVQMGVGLSITIAVALLIFVVTPAIRSRVDRCHAPSPEAAERIVPTVAGLAATLGVEAPLIVLRPSATATAHVLGGGWGRPRLVLTEPMVIVATRDPHRFRAVVAHELGHLRNRDVRLAELAHATWWALVLAGLLPYVVAALASGYFTSTWPMLTKLIIVVLLARLLRNGLLRSREHEADLRASTVAGVGQVLLQLFGSPGRGRRGGVLRPHPAPGRRAAVVAEPDLVLRTSPVDLFSLTAIGYLLVPAISFWLQQATYGRPVSSDLATVVAWLVAAAVGVGVWALAWREAVACRITGLRRPVVVPGGMALAGGLVLGALLIPVPRDGAAGLVDGVTPVQGLVLAAFAVVLCTAVQGLATGLAGCSAAQAGPGRPRRFGRLAAALCVALLAAVSLDAGSRLVLYTSDPAIGVPLGLEGTFRSLAADTSTWVLLGLAVAMLLVALLPALITAGTGGRRAGRHDAVATPAWMVMPMAGQAGATTDVPWQAGPRA